MLAHDEASPDGRTTSSRNGRAVTLIPMRPDSAVIHPASRELTFVLGAGSQKPPDPAWAKRHKAKPVQRLGCRTEGFVVLPQEAMHGYQFEDIELQTGIFPNHLQRRDLIPDPRDVLVELLDLCNVELPLLLENLQRGNPLPKAGEYFGAR